MKQKEFYASIDFHPNDVTPLPSMPYRMLHLFSRFYNMLEKKHVKGVERKTHKKIG